MVQGPRLPRLGLFISFGLVGRLVEEVLAPALVGLKLLVLDYF